MLLWTLLCKYLCELFLWVVNSLALPPCLLQVQSSFPRYKVSPQQRSWYWQCRILWGTLKCSSQSRTLHSICSQGPYQISEKLVFESWTLDSKSMVLTDPHWTAVNCKCNSSEIQTWMRHGYCLYWPTRVGSSVLQKAQGKALASLGAI